MTRWEKNARLARAEYGAYVEWENRFYICPFCEEPVYEEDWSDEELDEFLCPICEDIDRD